MRARVRLLPPAALAFVALMTALPASADQGTEAEVILKRGLTELAAKHTDQAQTLLEQACTALYKAYRDEQRPQSLFNLAICEEARDHFATAAARYDEYFALMDRLSEPERAAEAARQREAASRRQAIDPFIPTVTLVLPSDTPEGTRVTRLRKNGDQEEMSVGVPLRLDPGSHTIATQVGDGPRADTVFTVAKGDKNKLIKLRFVLGDPSSRQVQPGRPSSPVSSALPPLDPGISGWRATAYTVGAVGIAGLLLGVVSGAITWAQKSVIDGNCVATATATMMTPQVCNAAGQSAADTAHTWGIVSTPSFIAGGALVATGIILYVTEPAPPKLQGTLRRLSVGVAGLDYRGATVGATWAW
jgi:hypothetical protein